MSLRALARSGKAPAALILRLISPCSRSRLLVVRSRGQCASGNAVELRRCPEAPLQDLHGLGQLLLPACAELAQELLRLGESGCLEDHRDLTRHALA